MARRLRNMLPTKREPVRRYKSAEEIADQRYRLSKALSLRGYRQLVNRDMEGVIQTNRRLERVIDTADRYINNISNVFGNRGGYISNSQNKVSMSRGVYTGNKDAMYRAKRRMQGKSAG